jgi:hypothetical protein
MLGMGIESVLLALPLILISALLARIDYPMLMNLDALSGSEVVLSIGAGIYEELIFRLIGFALIHFVLVDFLSIRASIALPVMVILSGIGFSLYHYWGPEAFEVQTFAFRTLAGIYFGAVMIWRGFGVTAGCHASYDLLICGLRALSHVA